MNVILWKDRYALIDRGHEYVVAYGFDGEQWMNGTYFTHWNQSETDKQKSLSAALEHFRLKTEGNYIHRHRLEELATKFKDRLIEDDYESTMEFFDYEMTKEEKEWFGIKESEEE